MNTNHKPATALPWAQGMRRGENGNTIFARDGKDDFYDSAVCSGYGPLNQDVETVNKTGAGQDLAYICHAANAYPELVEALKELVARCDGAEGVRADGSNIQTHNAHGILSKLGEA